MTIFTNLLKLIIWILVRYKTDQEQNNKNKQV